MRHRIPVLLLSLPLSLCAGGCPLSNHLIAEIPDTECQLEFANIQPAERERVLKVIKAYAAKGEVRQLNDDPSILKVSFRMDHVYELDSLHTELVYPDDAIKSSAPNDDGANKAFNIKQQRFTARYETIRLAGSITVTVRFTVTPGAKLFYRPEGQSEMEVKQPANNAGAVEFPATIRRGQEWIYARTESGDVRRYIRINVYTQAVEDIPKTAYPK